VNLFIQGMRRSGTTILYDALRADPELSCFYEPLREEAVTRGGGSGARAEDAFAETRELRARFRDERFPELPIELFNWGGPREPVLELEPSLPEHCRELLRYLLGRGEAVAIKETRLWAKVGELADLDPDAALIHVVRDPRAVASSTALGRGQRHRDRLRDPDAFFGDRKRRKLWSSRAISEQLLKRQELRRLRRPSNVLRVLLVWRESFERCWGEGRERFGDRYVLIRNEDLRAQPRATLERLYAAIGGEPPDSVLEWAEANVRPAELPFAADDRRWLEEIERGGLETAIDRAGYSEVLAATLER
jgi:Sulfotransferase family